MTNSPTSPGFSHLLVQPSPLCARAAPRRGSRASRAPDPARPADRAELLLLGGVLERGIVALGRWRVAAEEVDVDLADEPAAELGVADARALVRRGRLGARDRGGDIVGDNAGGRLGEDPGLGNGPRARTDVAQRIDA